MAIWDIKERNDLVRANQDELNIQGSRGIFMGGFAPTVSAGECDIVDYISIAHGGVAGDFGNLSAARSQNAGFGSNSRAVCSGGGGPDNGGDVMNVIDIATIMSTGNFADFGNLSVSRRGVSGCSNQTRGLTNGGEEPGLSNVIDFITIASAGNAADFGNLVTAGGGTGSLSSPTRAVVSEGYIAPGAASTNLAYYEIASTGNAADFGNLDGERGYMGGCAGGQRGLFAGGKDPGFTNTIMKVQIDTLGNAVDFGDLTVARGETMPGTSNAHGGLKNEDIFFPRPSVNYMPGSGRVLTNGGNSPYGGTIEVFNITVKGSSSDFGDSAGGTTRAYCGATSNMTRALFMGGDTPAKTNLVDAIEFASLGNSFDFGNLTAAKGTSQGLASTTRAVNAGGVDPSAYFNVIEYVAIATAGNFADFGDLSATTGGPAGLSSPTRGLYIGGYTPSADNKIDYITIASTGNATDFGNSTTATVYAAGAASETRGLRLAGVNGTNVIDYMTIANTGNATDFGDLTAARSSLGGGSNNILAAAIGGSGVINTIDFVTIATTGDATDFGDCTVARGYHSSASDSHGGLQG